LIDGWHRSLIQQNYNVNKNTVPKAIVRNQEGKSVRVARRFETKREKRCKRRGTDQRTLKPCRA
jgi:hypothetical protein